MNQSQSKTMYKVIKKLSLLIVFPFLLGSTCLSTDKNNTNDFNSYQIIDIVTGEKKDPTSYTEEEVMQTYSFITSLIMKTLAKEGVDLSTVDITLYFAWMLGLEDSPKIKWLSTKDKQTISSPWMELTKIISSTGDTAFTIRLDATYSRLIFDVFGESKYETTAGNFLGVPLVKDTCFQKIVYDYLDAVASSENLIIRQVPKSFDCAPEILRKPLFNWFESSQLDFSGTFLFYVLKELDVNCQDAAREFYKELYSLLAVRALEILDSQLEPNPIWWRDVIEEIEPIKKCQS